MIQFPWKFRMDLIFGHLASLKFALVLKDTLGCSLYHWLDSIFWWNRWSSIPFSHIRCPNSKFASNMPQVQPGMHWIWMWMMSSPYVQISYDFLKQHKTCIITGYFCNCITVWADWFLTRFPALSFNVYDYLVIWLVPWYHLRVLSSYSSFSILELLPWLSYCECNVFICCFTGTCPFDASILLFILYTRLPNFLFKLVWIWLVFCNS